MDKMINFSLLDAISLSRSINPELTILTDTLNGRVFDGSKIIFETSGGNPSESVKTFLMGYMSGYTKHSSVLKIKS